MSRTKRTLTRTTWHPTPGTVITATGLNAWLVGHPTMTITGKVLGTGRCNEGSGVQGVESPAVCQLHNDIHAMNDYVDALIEDVGGKRWRVTACMGEIEVTEKVVHTISWGKNLAADSKKFE